MTGMPPQMMGMMGMPNQMMGTSVMPTAPNFGVNHSWHNTNKLHPNLNHQIIHSSARMVFGSGQSVSGDSVMTDDSNASGSGRERYKDLVGFVNIVASNFDTAVVQFKKGINVD
jgi:hypothetical protein